MTSQPRRLSLKKQQIFGAEKEVESISRSYCLYLIGSGLRQGTSPVTCGPFVMVSGVINGCKPPLDDAPSKE